MKGRDSSRSHAWAIIIMMHECISIIDDRSIETATTSRDDDARAVGDDVDGDVVERCRRRARRW